MPGSEGGNELSRSQELSWVVQAWKERGLLSESCQYTSPDELAALHSNSWFVRRNRRHVTTAAAPSATELSWVARRNRRLCASAPLRAKPQSPGSTSRPGLLRLNSCSNFLAAIQSKLPQDVRPALAVPAAASAIASATLRRPSQGDRDLSNDSSLHPEVYLTLYDLNSCCNSFCAHRLGIGIYHSGVLVQGLEYTYDNTSAGAGSGVVAHEVCGQERHPGGYK